MTNSYVNFNLIEQKPKTSIFSVDNNNSGIRLGIIKWFSSWRQYCFFPTEETVFSQGCMKEIQDFIQNLKKERKEKLK